MAYKQFVIMLLCSTSLIVMSQPAKFTHIEDGDEHIKHGNYLMAIPVYQNELKKDPDNVKIKYRLGVCYLNTRINQEQAVKYLEAASKDPKTDNEIWFFLGIAYHLTNQLEDALISFEKYKALKTKNKNAEEVKKYIKQCDNAMKLMRKPSNVTFQNLGKGINSDEPDYNPFIDKDEMFMVFTSRRKDNIGGKKIEVDGYRSSDIYQSTMVDGHWTTAKSVGRAVNGTLDEQCVGLSADGTEMYVYEDHIQKFGDLYVSKKKDSLSEFSKPKILDPIINEMVETSGCLNADGTVLFFARRDDINDNSDLYMSRKLPNGKWAIPQILPPEINTNDNEDMPFLSIDGETLYFSSDGMNSIGGYDLFKTTWNQTENTFSKPINLGYPINSTDDDKSISVTKDNRFAYVSAFRPNGIGDLDIYRVKFNDMEPVVVIFTGKVFFNDTIASNQPKNYALNIIATNKKTNYEYTFVPHSKTGKFVIAVPAGVYSLSLSVKGYAKFEEEFEVSDMGKVNLVRTKNILLKKTK